MDDGIYLFPDDDGVFHVYDDEFDITVHCETAKEQELAMSYLSKGPRAFEFIQEQNLTVQFNQWLKEKGYEV